MDTNIFAFKLTSGEEIISRLIQTENQEDIFLLDNPRVLMIGQDGRFMLAPLMFSSDSDKPIKLQKSSVACYSENVKEELSNGYIGSISKIAIPPKGMLFE